MNETLSERDRRLFFDRVYRAFRKIELDRPTVALIRPMSALELMDFYSPPRRLISVEPSLPVDALIKGRIRKARR